MSKNQDPMARFVESCLQDEEIQKCTTNSEVFNVIKKPIKAEPLLLTLLPLPKMLLKAFVFV